MCDTISMRMARGFPSVAGALVTHPEADTQNAWDVLVEAFGTREAELLVRAFPHPRATRTADEVLAEVRS